MVSAFPIAAPRSGSSLGCGASDHNSGWRGKLVHDGYTGYKQLPTLGVTAADGLTHARRKFSTCRRTTRARSAAHLASRGVVVPLLFSRLV